MPVRRSRAGHQPCGLQARIHSRRSASGLLLRLPGSPAQASTIICVKPTIVYILGLGHSGTTILQYLLASGPGALGLGEVRKLTDGSGWENAAGACSCGRYAETCPAWCDLKPAAGQTGMAWYRQVVGTLSERYPSTTHWIDTSKTPGGFQPWLALRAEGIIADIKLLFLVRDVRAWVVSDDKARRRKGRPPRPLPLPILSWWRGQRDIERFLAAGRLDYRVVSHEGVIFRTQAVMRAIAHYTGIHGLERSWETDLGEAEVHDVFGNRVKDDAARRSRLVYEDEWQYRPWLNLLTPTVWPAWRMNTRLHRQALGASL